MWTTFVITLKSSVRTKSALFWMIVFPLALATMFNGLLGGIEDAMKLTAVPVAVVQDTNWKDTMGAQSFIDALAGKQATSSDDAIGAAAGDNIDVTLLSVTDVGSVDQAKDKLEAGDVDGYLAADKDGFITLTLADTTVTRANDSQTAGLDVSLAALHSVLDQYNRTSMEVRTAIEEHPESALTRTFWDGVSGSASATHEVSLTHFKPDSTARYYYALLGMACMMAMSFMIAAIATSQANLSALGIRRTVSPLPRSRQIIASFFAGWVCTVVSLLIALVYIHTVCDISFGGRGPMVVLAVFAASFMTCACGTMIGAIPKLSRGTKEGLASAIACTLSLFTGLYGGFAMELNDAIIRNAPLLADINPAQQVVNLFYSLMYYDTYGPFARTCGILAIMSVLFLAVAIVLLRRQRYEHL